MSESDIPDVPNQLGMRDLGAYELQNGATGCDEPELIFVSGFE